MAVKIHRITSKEVKNKPDTYEFTVRFEYRGMVGRYGFEANLKQLENPVRDIKDKIKAYAIAEYRNKDVDAIIKAVREELNAEGEKDTEPVGIGQDA